MITRVLTALLPLLAAAGVSGTAATTTKNLLQVPLEQYFNNKAFGLYPGEASFDQNQQSYPAAQLPPGPTYTSRTGFTYLFPGYQKANKSDNILCTGQTVTLPSQQKYFSVQMLVAAENNTASGNVTLLYADNTTEVAELRSQNWFTFLGPPKGEIILPSRFTHNDTNWNTSHIFEWITAANPLKELTAVKFPSTGTSSGRLHVFSVSLWKAGRGLEVQYLRPTQKWVGDHSQVVEVGINNAGDTFMTGTVTVEIRGPGIKTVEKGTFSRLVPGDQKIVAVAVSGRSKNTTADVIVASSSVNSTSKFTGIDLGLEEYTEDLHSLTLHESPDWFNGAKFGIFIRPYAVPGWGNSTPYEVYAEWYWWYGHHRNADKADIYDYHLREFGPDVIYDDFFQNFTGANWDPKGWVDLFADAGANYWVLTTKHHDGFALFDTGNTSNRNSLLYGPKRDVVGELFNASAIYQPHLRRGTYFSLPEWFNPAYGPYGMSNTADPASSSWPGIIANNPYTGAIEPYTGYIEVNDYIWDLMVPQMNTLAYKYNTDIMWCDCGAANGSARFASAWYNYAKKQDRQVTMNSRCGIPQGSDFDTPEYATFSSVSERKWESNQGMDPFSYGYNRATPANSYMNSSTIVTTLIDMVSKNGNMLLDVGPKADGTIDETEATHLREAGTWLKAHAESIYNTTHWFITPQEGKYIRFTQSSTAFYIHFLTKPEVNTTLLSPIPILDSDRPVLMGLGGNMTEVKWSRRAGGGVSFLLPEELTGTGKYAWVVKIPY